jgi:hypothetical protein
MDAAIAAADHLSSFSLHIIPMLELHLTMYSIFPVGSCSHRRRRRPRTREPIADESDVSEHQTLPQDHPETL